LVTRDGAGYAACKKLSHPLGVCLWNVKRSLKMLHCIFLKFKLLAVRKSISPVEIAWIDTSLTCHVRCRHLRAALARCILC
jgi:hypothetical protein